MTALKTNAPMRRSLSHHSIAHKAFPANYQDHLLVPMLASKRFSLLAKSVSVPLRYVANTSFVVYRIIFKTCRCANCHHVFRFVHQAKMPRFSSGSLHCLAFLHAGWVDPRIRRFERDAMVRLALSIPSLFFRKATVLSSVSGLRGA